VTALAATRKRRTLLAFLAGVVIAAAVPAFAYSAVQTIRTSREGTNAVQELPPLKELPPTPGALLVGVDDRGEATSITVFALAPSGAGGTAIVLPVTSQARLPSGVEDGAVADAYADGGLDALRAAVEGLMGITLSFAGEVDREGLVALLEPLGTLRVTMPTTALDRSDSGDIVLLDQGTFDVEAATAAGILLASPTSQVEDERLPAVTSVWSAIASRVGSGLAYSAPDVIQTGTTDPEDITVTRAPGLPENMQRFVSAVFSGPLGVWQLTGDRIDASDGRTLIRLDLGELMYVVATVMPDAVSPPEITIRMQVLSPLGDPSVTMDAVARLAYAGANIVLVREVDLRPAPSRSVMEYLTEDDRLDAENYETVLGDVEYRAATERIDGIDVTVILGSDYRPTTPRPTGTTTTTKPETSG
jgi:hypothetical protein